MVNPSAYVKVTILSLLIHGLHAFSTSKPFTITRQTSTSSSSSSNTNVLSTLNESPSSSSSPPSSSLSLSSTLEKNPKAKPSDEWELDCYSRPVMVGGKKLWEVLITDSTGSFRLCETLPSNK